MQHFIHIKSKKHKVAPISHAHWTAITKNMCVYVTTFNMKRIKYSLIAQERLKFYKSFTVYCATSSFPLIITTIQLHFCMYTVSLLIQIHPTFLPHSYPVTTPFTNRTKGKFFGACFVYFNIILTRAPTHVFTTMGRSKLRYVDMKVCDYYYLRRTCMHSMYNKKNKVFSVTSGRYKSKNICLLSHN